MTFFAKDIMVTEFDTIHEDEPVEKAIQMILNGKLRKTGHKTISLIVIDDFNHLAGVITMFDILYHLRPSFLNYGINGEEMQWSGQVGKLIDDIKGKRVKQVMSEHVMGASPDEHLMVLLDRMIKNKFRRLPVLQDHKPVGIVYIADVYYYLFSDTQKK
ncbi:MAG: CBS domain-containing protein [Desulfobacteraceae bacterium]|nr:MAG: CBS domain-containing protein [Desulfobacteraceae bacterium]